MTVRESLMTDKQARFDAGREQRIISTRAYNLIIGGCLFYGFAVNAFMMNTFTALFSGMNMWALLIGYIVCVIAGALLTNSDSAAISFVGYNLIVLPIGAVLSVLLPVYAAETVFNAVVMTGIITLVMMLAGTIFPNIFLTMGRTLFILLIAVIVVEMAAVFVFHRDLAALDYAVVVIFSGYIGYDWATANIYPKTVNNAVDSATDLYMDIINIFIRLLAILSRE